jgi:hypothetical protein
MQPLFIMKMLGRVCLGVPKRIICISIISYGKNSLDLGPTWVTTSPRGTNWVRKSRAHCTWKTTKVTQMKTRRNRNLRYSIVLHVGMFRNRLEPAVRWKRRGLWSSGVSAAWQDPTSCSRRTAKQILDLKMQVLPLSAIFARFSTRRFSPLWHVKDSVCGRHFRSDEEVNEAEQDWLVQQPKDFFSCGI